MKAHSFHQEDDYDNDQSNYFYAPNNLAREFLTPETAASGNNFYEYDTPDNKPCPNLQSLLHEDAHIDGLLMPQNLNMLIEGMDAEYDDEDQDLEVGEELCYFDEYGDEVVEDEAMYEVEIDDELMNGDGLKPAESVSE